jgi:hypothetical protein
MPRFLLLVLCLLSAACSMRSAIDAMTSPEDRAFAQAMVDHLRRGDEAWLRERFDPELWAQSGKQIGGVPGLFPRVPGETEIISFSTNTSIRNGATERNREFTLVTHGGGRWTVTKFRTWSQGGPDRVVQWSVVPHGSAPPELTMLETVDNFLPWLWGTLLVGILLVAALIVWLVRRSRRKTAANAGIR